MNHELKVPIINNPLDQTSLFKVLEKAFEANPQTIRIRMWAGNSIPIMMKPACELTLFVVCLKNCI